MTEKHKTSPKDIFLQLLAIVTLYGSAIAFLTLLFQFINSALPDPLAYYSLSGVYSSIRFAVSSLIVVFPVYVWVMRLLMRAYAADPARKDVRIRKWLTHFTIFAAGIIIMGDLVALVFSFLNGELTARFVLKAGSVFLVAGTIFLYYYWDVKDRIPKNIALFHWTVIGVVSAGIFGAFFVVGSPQQERLYRFDEERVRDLQSIQWQVVNYWQQKGALPASLSVLEEDAISGFQAPVDPQTGNIYEYRTAGETMFELCAAFSLASRSAGNAPRTAPVSEFGANWDHAAGRTCFERTIDPDLYPVREDAVKVPALR